MVHARACLAVAVAAALLGAPARRAASETRPRYGRVLIGTLLGQPATFDPALARSHAEVQVVRLLFDTLYRADAEGRIEPHLAAAMPVISADGLEARVPLRPGVLFQDGSPLGPDDVLASLDRVAHSQAAWLLAPVAARSRDGDELVFRLRRPTPELAEILSAPATSVTPGGRAPSPVHPIGSGPFALMSRPGATQLVLTAFERHFAGRPYADRLELRWYQGTSAEARAYEVGALNLSLRGAVAFTGHTPRYPTEVTASPATVLVYVGFGRAHGRAFDDVDLRRALSLAIGRDALRLIGTGERVAPTPWPVAVDLGGREPEPADLEAQPRRAQAALALARRHVAALAGGARPVFQILVDRTRPDDREIGEKVAAALWRMGLGARIVELGAADLEARIVRGDFDLYIGQLAAAGPSPALQLAGAFAAGGDSWARAQMAAGPLDPGAALAAFARRLPLVPLFHRAVRVHHRVDIRRVDFDATGQLLYADMFLFGGYDGSP